MNDYSDILNADKPSGFSLAIISLIVLVIFAADISVPLGVAGGVPYIAPVLLSLRSQTNRSVYILAGICSLLTIAGFALSASSTAPLWEVIVNRFLAIFAIWVTTIIGLLQRRYYYEREAAFAKMQILQGLLPICAGCKKIRSEDGAWSSLETYIREHSEAEFSHGLCPDCSKKTLDEFAHPS